ncbi:alpha/beta hydrolase [Silvimonas iriomotensis]|uniref:Alpha/beta hydrolase n=1 Tax=Silvimonas iriomotensis TaxID=449662 RepID=A0ABQ2PFA0_9NEIS|nr:alpha/beta fold hydrolase [Silvimonas iriomotensis]GGP24003.1 alpha/beta hydrolase [Silvimonas iriomotensis]
MAQISLSVNYRNQVLAGSAHLPEAGVTGDAVLLLHGFTGSRIEFAYLFVELGRYLAAQGLTVFRFDFAGCGESTGHFADLSIADQIMQTDVLLDELAERYPGLRWHVFGYSMGALAAASVGARRGDLASLVLLAPAGTVGQYLQEVMAHSPRLDNGSADFIGLEISPALVAEALAFDLNATLTHAHASVMVIHGGKDIVVKPEVGQQAAMAAGGRFVLMPEADHGLCFGAHRREMAQTVAEWIIQKGRE